MKKKKRKRKRNRKRENMRRAAIQGITPARDLSIMIPSNAKNTCMLMTVSCAIEVLKGILKCISKLLRKDSFATATLKAQIREFHYSSFAA